MAPTNSPSAPDPSSSPVVPQDSSGGRAGDPGQPVIPLLDGQLPPGFVPLAAVSSPSQPPPRQMTPMFSYSTPSAPTNGAVASPRLDPRALYSVPVPDTSSSSGRHSLNNSVRIPLSSTTATGDSSVMVPPASLFSQPNEPSSSETDEDDAVASSITSSNDTLSTPPPSSKKAKARKEAKAKKAKRPTYDAAPVAPGLAYPSSPLVRASTLASPGPSATSASQGRRGPAGMTPASRNRNLHN
ncbi:hypothetical protein DFH94DRAFT_716151 [Russula ochroleuca]|jgi:hypothetical protein|uniref:Uncharacterized protein n=1 Tax=Russula ochroleuca TaxID=152965 RepID=A0A9P5TCI7_9AGAM|nr:hypothetical protein DFH94DRAFT_716151 [Russula ochroleuca]